MNIEKANKLFQLAQALQLGLLTAQGLLIILTKDVTFYAPIWIGLALLALAQVGLIFYYPKQVKTTQIMQREAMIKLRLLALLPYVLIITGLLIAH